MKPKKISRMYKNSSALCWKRESQEGSYYHLWWTCNVAKSFWSDIHTEMIQILGYTFNKLPEIYLLSLYMDSFPLKDRTVIWYGFYAARSVYAQQWRGKETPGIGKWIIKLNEMMVMDNLTKYQRDKKKEGHKTDWVKFREYLIKYKKMVGTGKILGEL